MTATPVPGSPAAVTPPLPPLKTLVIGGLSAGKIYKTTFELVNSGDTLLVAELLDSRGQRVVGSNVAVAPSASSAAKLPGAVIEPDSVSSKCSLIFTHDE